MADIKTLDDYGMNRRPSTPDELYTPTIDQLNTHPACPPNFTKHLIRDMGLKGVDDYKVFNVLQSAQGNPDLDVTVYRAAPSQGILNHGDYVSLSKAYCEKFLERCSLDGDVEPKIYEYQVKAKDISWSMNSIHDLGYFGEQIVPLELQEELGLTTQSVDDSPALETSPSAELIKDKEFLEKKMWGCERLFNTMSRNPNMTPQQHEFMREIATIRHYIHKYPEHMYFGTDQNGVNIRDVFDDYFMRLISENQVSKLGIEFPHEAVKQFNSLSKFEDFSNAEMSFDEHRRMFAEEKEIVNDAFENYLARMDREYGTSYCPNGMKRDGQLNTIDYTVDKLGQQYKASHTMVTPELTGLQVQDAAREKIYRDIKNSGYHKPALKVLFDSLVPDGDSWAVKLNIEFFDASTKRDANDIINRPSLRAVNIDGVRVPIKLNLTDIDSTYHKVGHNVEILDQSNVNNAGNNQVRNTSHNNPRDFDISH